MDAMSCGLMPMSRPPGPGVNGTPSSRYSGWLLPSVTFCGGGAPWRDASVPDVGVYVVAPNEPAAMSVTRSAPPPVLWMLTPDERAWSSSTRIDELLVSPAAGRCCDGAEAQPAAIRSTDAPSIAREKLQTM